MEKRELPDIHEPKKPPMSEKKKQSILEKLWLTYYNDTLLEKGVISQEERQDAGEDQDPRRFHGTIKGHPGRQEKLSCLPCT